MKAMEQESVKYIIKELRLMSENGCHIKWLSCQGLCDQVPFERLFVRFFCVTGRMGEKGAHRQSCFFPPPSDCYAFHPKTALFHDKIFCFYG